MAQNQRRESRSLVTVHPPRLPYPPQAAGAGIDEGRWKALTDAIFPAAKTVDGVMLAIAYAKARNLDIFKKVVHVVPMWNAALGQEVDTVWPGIGELRTTASRTGSHAGNDDCVFGDPKCQGFSASRERQARGDQGASLQRAECPKFTWPEWAQITVYKMVQGQRVAFVGPKVRFLETFSGVKGLRVPNDRWQLAPYQMLEKCAEAAALRRAFPEELGDQWTAEEMEGKEAIFGEFSVVADAGDQGDGAEGEKRPARPKRKAWSDEIDQALVDVQGRLDRTNNPDVLPAKLDEFLDGHADWPAAAKQELRRRFDDRIAKLNEGRPAGQETQAEAAAGLVKHRQYIELFGSQIRMRVGNVPDINSYVSGERQTVDELPPALKAGCEQLLAIAIAVSKDGGDADEFDRRLEAARATEEAGETAASEDHQSQRPEEEEE